jgi:hypothetical protein
VAAMMGIFVIPRSIAWQRRWRARCSAGCPRIPD